MTEQHRATPQQWLAMELDSQNFAAASTILELRDRIEALEAKDEDDKIDWTKMRRPGRSQGERINSLVKRIEALENDRRAVLGSGSRLRVGLDTAEPEEPKHPAKPDSSLVERLALTLAGPNDDAELWMLDARAAIREVAAWMTGNPDHHFPPALVFALEQEAER